MLSATGGKGAVPKKRHARATPISPRSPWTGAAGKQRRRDAPEGRRPGVPLPIPAGGGKAPPRAYASKAEEKPSLPGSLSAGYLRFITSQTPNSSAQPRQKRGCPRLRYNPSQNAKAGPFAPEPHKAKCWMVWSAQRQRHATGTSFDAVRHRRESGSSEDAGHARASRVSPRSP